MEYVLLQNNRRKLHSFLEKWCVFPFILMILQPHFRPKSGKGRSAALNLAVIHGGYRDGVCLLCSVLDVRTICSPLGGRLYFYKSCTVGQRKPSLEAQGPGTRSSHCYAQQTDLLTMLRTHVGKAVCKHFYETDLEILITNIQSIWVILYQNAKLF